MTISKCSNCGALRPEREEDGVHIIEPCQECNGKNVEIENDGQENQES